MPYERAAGGYMAARKASKKVINFFVVGLTYGCLNPCIDIVGISAFLQSLNKTPLTVELYILSLLLTKIGSSLGKSFNNCENCITVFQSN